MPTYTHSLDNEVHTIMASESGPGVKVDTGQKQTILEVWLKGAKGWVPFDNTNEAHREMAHFPNYGALHRVIITAAADPATPPASVGV